MNLNFPLSVCRGEFDFVVVNLKFFHSEFEFAVVNVKLMW